MKNLTLPLLLPTLITLSTPSSAQLHKDNSLSKDIGHVLAVGDFNGDGYKDQAIGAPDAVADQSADGSGVRAGVVHVTYGNSQGLGTWLNQYWHQESAPGVPGANEDGDRFGAALAVGDFNGDGYHDLAIGCPGKNIGDINSAGAVVILYGTWLGLSSTGAQSFNQLQPQVANTSEAYDQFGFSLAAGNFDNDNLTSSGCDDLAVGVPHENLWGTADVGMLNILTGTPSGLTSNPSSRVYPPSMVRQYFGFALAAGELNGGSYTDLVVTAPEWTVDPIASWAADDPTEWLLPNAGTAYVLRGSSIGLRHTGLTLGQKIPYADFLSSGSTPYYLTDAGDDAYAGGWDWFGWSVACGDFNGDGVDDVVIGAPGESVGSLTSPFPPTTMLSGAINIFLMEPSEPSYQVSVKSEYFRHQSPGKKETGDFWGSSLCTGDLDNDGADDIIVGAAWEGVHSTTAAGCASVLFGGVGFLSDTRLLHQDTPGVPGVSESQDFFARSVCAGDFNGDGHAELSVGVPGEVVGSAGYQSGFVQVFDVSSYRQITWSQDLKEQ